METPYDDVVEHWEEQIKVYEAKVDSLKLEQGTLQDMVRDPQKLGADPLMAERLEQIPAEISAARATVDRCSSELKDTEASRKEFVLEAERREMQQLNEKAFAPTREGEGVKAGVEAMHAILHPPAEMNHLRTEVGPRVSTGDVVVTNPSPHGHGFGLDVAAAIATGAVATKLHERHERQEGEANDRNSAQIAELQSLKADPQVKDVASLEKDAQGRTAMDAHVDQISNASWKELDANGRRQAERNEFDAAAQKMNDLYQAQDQQRRDLGIGGSQRDAQWQGQWHEESRQLCESEAARRVDHENKQMLDSYRERNANQPEKVQQFEQDLASSRQNDIQQRTSSLHQETFPQIAARGPELQGPAQQGPGGGGGPGGGAGAAAAAPAQTMQPQQQMPGPGGGPGF